MRSEITSHLNFNNIISDAQHGFCKKRSCETQLILTIDDLAREIDKGGQIDMILLDLSKAFDRVPHHRFILKLKSYGITGNTNKWIQDKWLLKVNSRTLAQSHQEFPRAMSLFLHSFSSTSMTLVKVLSPQYSSSPTTLYFTTPSRLILTPPIYKMTSKHSNHRKEGGRWPSIKRNVIN